MTDGDETESPGARPGEEPSTAQSAARRWWRTAAKERAALATLAVFLYANYGYAWVARQFADPDKASRWLYQAGMGLEVVTACAWVAWYTRSYVLLLAAMLGMIEQYETVICDTLWWNDSVGPESRVCVAQFGDWPYKVVFCASVSFLIVRYSLWKRRDS